MLLAIWTGCQVYYALRTRAMQSLAQRWNLRYVGPAPPRGLWPVTHPIFRPPIPRWVSHLNLFGQISRIWNVVEGSVDGNAILIFDVIVGKGRGTHPCTLILYKTCGSPVYPMARVDRTFEKDD